MNYQQAIHYIESTYIYGSKPGLDTIQSLLKLLGNPQKDLKIIHVAGTNGKGSTSSFIHSVLKTAGYKVGLYTSPYIVEFTECIQINGEKIHEERLAANIATVKEKIEFMLKEGENHPTAFEIETAIALWYFAQDNVDFAIVEVGMGGRLDATNVVDTPLLSVITPIDYDHMGFLGNTLEEIAFEKAGIIKENSYVVSHPQQAEAMEVIKSVSKERKSKLIITSYENLDIQHSTIEEQQFSVEVLGNIYENIRISLAGTHQIYNCCMALTALEALKKYHAIDISQEAIYKGLYHNKWIGRLEVINKNPLTIIDGAHNLQGAKALQKSVEALLKEYGVTFVVGMLKDKDIKGVLKHLIPLMDRIIVTKPNNPRAMEAEDLAKELADFGKDIYVCKTVREAVNKAYEITEASDAVLVAGSLYLLGEARSVILGNQSANKKN
ncbi:dihydrofolate synthase / folylpolyglutamate synthase [Natronincola peptidivorans]|uniref:tetrahydrofolate synthase n=1 Tax=Natronincola peptidivorans TaxID=426128 RepID=A0A1I0H2A2_9FIRM|nr:folylpolyglutamate synthase/dihydrofolate synthase family protein [Natronincola peptidivorans]SET77661.1 dihydrofolate synthase / folylpolyglutamate synthase [Natronincola peptidivorans]